MGRIHEKPMKNYIKEGAPPPKNKAVGSRNTFILSLYLSAIIVFLGGSLFNNSQEVQDQFITQRAEITLQVILKSDTTKEEVIQFKIFLDGLESVKSYSLVTSEQAQTYLKNGLALKDPTVWQILKDDLDWEEEIPQSWVLYPTVWKASEMKSLKKDLLERSPIASKVDEVYYDLNSQHVLEITVQNSRWIQFLLRVLIFLSILLLGSAVIKSFRQGRITLQKIKNRFFPRILLEALAGIVVHLTIISAKAYALDLTPNTWFIDWQSHIALHVILVVLLSEVLYTLSSTK